MGHSQQDKAATHARIVEIASKRLREKGLEGIGVADLMKEAGLTVGGFYKHFESRDALVLEAVQAAFTLWKGAQDNPQLDDYSYEKLVDGYLSPAHRGNAGAGCPFAAFSADLARADPRTRAMASKQLQLDFDMIGRLIAKQSGDEKGIARPSKEQRAQAMLAFSAMIGAVSLARVMEDEGEAEELMKAVAGQLRKLPA
jgi:TetR/AcrR family transcriptional repressor of nem operon